MAEQSVGPDITVQTMALFSFPSHRIFGHMYEALNINKK
jgi:hypothetical protein